MARSEGDAAERVCAQAVERLVGVFGALPAELVAEVVCGAERELRGQVGAEAMAELLERLAAHRLAELVDLDR